MEYSLHYVHQRKTKNLLNLGIYKGNGTTLILAFNETLNRSWQEQKEKYF